MRLGEQKNYPMSNDIARWHDDTGWFGVLKKHIPLSIYLSIVQKLNFLREGIHILLHLNFEIYVPSLPTCHHFYSINIWSNVTSWRTPPSPFKEVMSFMNAPIGKIHMIYNTMDPLYFDLMN